MSSLHWIALSTGLWNAFGDGDAIGENTTLVSKGKVDHI